MNMLQVKLIFLLTVNCCVGAFPINIPNSSKQNRSLCNGFKMVKKKIGNDSHGLQNLQDYTEKIKPETWNSALNYTNEPSVRNIRNKVHETVVKDHKMYEKLDLTKSLKIKGLISRSNNFEEQDPEKLLRLKTTPNYVNHFENKQTKLYTNPLVENFKDILHLFNTTDIDDSAVQPLEPECKVGDRNCTKCKDISPFCHYMYSEDRCIFYNAQHSTQLYECSARWFPVDKNGAFLITLAVLLSVSFSAGGYMIWLRKHVILEGDLVIEDVEVLQMRNIIRRIRERRMEKEMASNSEPPD